MKRLGNQSDEELIEATRVEPEAFAALYRRYERVMLAFCARRVDPPEAAIDLTAEVFASALAEVHAGRPPSESVPGWLFAIARNKLIDSYRRGRVADDARRLLAMREITFHEDDLQRVHELACESDVTSLLDQLPIEQRRAVTARVVDELSYDEVAAHLACSEQVARKRVSRGLKVLRARMGEMT